ncbi:MAG: helix-turn-helix transcriptional regulator [Candidatus Doudnabacteria bacterium]|nr:helix-turn-helix transcriptional regulator [Candidatus Doudnabacteria bacterium]
MPTLERQLKALANKRRLAIIKFLDNRREASVGTIAGWIRLSFKSTSKHLSILSAVDIVDKEQRSKTVFYHLVSPKSNLVKQILSLL